MAVSLCTLYNLTQEQNSNIFHKLYQVLGTIKVSMNFLFSSVLADGLFLIPWKNGEENFPTNPSPYLPTYLHLCKFTYLSVEMNFT